MRTSSDATYRGFRSGGCSLWGLIAEHHAVQPPIIPPSLTAVVDPEDGQGVECTPFWRETRDVAALLFYIRKQGVPSVEYLVKPALYDPHTKRAWAEGIPPLPLSLLLVC